MATVPYTTSCGTTCHGLPNGQHGNRSLHNIVRNDQWSFPTTNVGLLRRGDLPRSPDGTAWQPSPGQNRAEPAVHARPGREGKRVQFMDTYGDMPCSVRTPAQSGSGTIGHRHNRSLPKKQPTVPILVYTQVTSFAVAHQLKRRKRRKL